MASNEWILEAKGNRSARERKRLVATLSLLQGTETADEELAPQSITGVFDEAFDLYKRHFVTFVLIAAVVLLPIQVICYGLDALWLHTLAASVASQEQTGNPNVGGATLLWLGYFLIGSPRQGIPGIFSFCMPFLISGPMAVAVSDSYLGRLPSARAAYRAAARYFPCLIRSYLLAGLCFVAVAFGGFLLISFVMFVVTVTIGALLPDVAAILILILAVIPYIVAGAFIARYFALTTPIAVLEGAPALFVTGRNMQLVGKLRYRGTLLAMIFLPILTYGFQAIFFYSLESAMGQFALGDATQFLLRTCIGGAATCFLQPYWMVFVTLLYYDYRIKRECFDVRILSAKLKELPPALPANVAAASPLYTGSPAPAHPAGPPIRPGGVYR